MDCNRGLRFRRRYAPISVVFINEPFTYANGTIFSTGNWTADGLDGNGITILANQAVAQSAGFGKAGSTNHLIVPAIDLTKAYSLSADVVLQSYIAADTSSFAQIRSECVAVEDFGTHNTIFAALQNVDGGGAAGFNVSYGIDTTPATLAPVAYVAGNTASLKIAVNAARLVTVSLNGITVGSFTAPAPGTNRNIAFDLQCGNDATRITKLDNLILTGTHL